MSPDDLLAVIVEQYLSSADFNGLYVDGTDPDVIEAAVELIGDGRAEIVSPIEFDNPHIRPWPNRRSPDEQIATLQSVPDDMDGLCLYPTAAAMDPAEIAGRFPGEPFRQRMALGGGALDLAYFRFDVLEQYRNDPRFRFIFSDFGTEAVISDDAYLDEDEPAHDKVIISHIGFAYDMSKYDADDPDTPIIRRVCVSLRDLTQLSGIHQQRWATYEVQPNDRLGPHPMWMAWQEGRWVEGRGPFDRFFGELEAINELYERAFGDVLFRASDRPDDFGWVLRATQRDLDEFIHTLDKLLSDNLSSSGLSAAGAPVKDENDQTIGTINRLAHVLGTAGLTDEQARSVLAAMREVRKARQVPAHKLEPNTSDHTVVRQQVELLERCNDMLITLRQILESHPSNKTWTLPDHLAGGPDYRM